MTYRLKYEYIPTDKFYFSTHFKVLAEQLLDLKFNATGVHAQIYLINYNINHEQQFG